MNLRYALVGLTLTTSLSMCFAMENKTKLGVRLAEKSQNLAAATDAPTATTDSEENLNSTLYGSEGDGLNVRAVLASEMGISLEELDALEAQKTEGTAPDAAEAILYNAAKATDAEAILHLVGANK